jgi:hypothetical protein
MKRRRVRGTGPERDSLPEPSTTLVVFLPPLRLGAEIPRESRVFRSRARTISAAASDSGTLREEVRRYTARAGRPTVLLFSKVSGRGRGNGFCPAQAADSAAGASSAPWRLLFLVDCPCSPWAWRSSSTNAASSCLRADKNDAMLMEVAAM